MPRSVAALSSRLAARAGQNHELEVGQLLDQRPRKGGAFAQQSENLERRQLLRRLLDRGEGLVENRDLDAALPQPVPVGHSQSDFLIIVEQGELERLRHGVSWKMMADDGGPHGFGQATAPVVRR